MTVHVSVERSGACWSFAITDNGIGILPQFYEKIFGVLQRLHSSDDYGGTGIGLAIFRKSIQKYGGTITVNYVSEIGSIFRFMLSD